MMTGARPKPPAAGKGRPKGTQNKTTRLLKEAILMAAEEAHPEGLVGYLRQQAMTNPGPFMSLLGKVLPMQVTGEDGGAVKVDSTIKVEFVRPGDASGPAS